MDDGTAVRGLPGVSREAPARRATAAALALMAISVTSLPAQAMPASCPPGIGRAALPANAWRGSAATDSLYVAVFSAGAMGRSVGNLKKYRLAGGQLLGQDGPATDAVTGRLRADAWSFWSATRDGDRVADGGAASRLPDWRDRRLYTNVAGAALSAGGNSVTADNAALTPGVLGGADTDRTALLEWLRGRDVLDADGDGDTAETRRELGATPRASPVVLDYGTGRGGTVVFLPTRAGYLHAFDGDTGDERWAFVPARLLPLLATRFAARDGAPAEDGLHGGLDGDLDGGLDGGIALHQVERDGRPGVGPEDQALLLFGMGRGGSAVFALDVADVDQPRLLWQIDDATPGFADLGESWSPPAVVELAVPGRVTGLAAALVAGGHDPAPQPAAPGPGHAVNAAVNAAVNPATSAVTSDGASPASGQDASGAGPTGRGNAVYLVDLQTGARLWSGGAPGTADPHDLLLPAMRYPVTATPRAVDLTGDGRADRFYVGDRGGQLWRFDIDAGGAAGISGGVLADLGAAGAGPASGPASPRRFSATPDVVPLVHYGQLVLAINLGSGDAEWPADTATADAFFSIRDSTAGRRPTGDYGPPMTTVDLIDVTTDFAPRLPPAARGWWLRLVQAPGEKVLAPSLAIRNELYFTSFTPDGDAACGAGTTRRYRISARDGRPLALPADGSGTPAGEPRSTRVGPGVPGLAPRATLAVEPGGTAEAPPVLQLCAGLACEALPQAGAPVPTYWYPEPVPPRR